MRSVPTLHLLGLMALPAPTPTAHAQSWLGENLVPNAGFEDGVQHWRTVAHGGSPVVRADTQGALVGRQSLRLDLAQSPAHVALESDPIAVQPGRTYLFSIGFRQEGFTNAKGVREKHEGVGAHSTVVWLDERQRRLSGARSISRCPYGPSRWDLRDGLVTAPASARFAVVYVGFSNNSRKHAPAVIPSTLWLDAVQLREYRPPETPEWAKRETTRLVDGVVDQSAVRSFFVAESREFRAKGGQWSKQIVDAQAERGNALLAPADAGHGLMAHSPYFGGVIPGLYRLRARVRVSDNTSPKRAGYIDVTEEYPGLRLVMDVMPNQFEAAGRYQVLEQDFVLRGAGWWSIRAYTEGNQAWAIDSIKIVPLCELRDRQLLSIFPASAGQVSPALRPRTRKPYRVLFVAGLGYDFHRPVQILRLLDLNVEITPVWVKRARSMTFAGWPETTEALFDHQVIVICNVSARAMSLRQKAFLVEYVRRGGALMVLGGHQSYERGGWRDSLLESVLPVRVLPSLEAGLVHSSDGLPVSLAERLPWLRESELDIEPRVYFLHQIQLTPGAQVFARAGSAPFVVGGAIGKGRVVCVLGLPQGNPAKGHTPFWAWSDWLYLMRNATWWAMRHPGLEGDR